MHSVRFYLRKEISKTGSGIAGWRPLQFRNKIWNSRETPTQFPSQHNAVSCLQPRADRLIRFLRPRDYRVIAPVISVFMTQRQTSLCRRSSRLLSWKFSVYLFPIDSFMLIHSKLVECYCGPWFADYWWKLNGNVLLRSFFAIDSMLM